jgi:hypothetical protein
VGVLLHPTPSSRGRECSTYPAHRRQRSARSGRRPPTVDSADGSRENPSGDSITAHKHPGLPSPVISGSSRSPAHLFGPRSSARASCTRRSRARYRDDFCRVRVAPLHTFSGATGVRADFPQWLSAWTCTLREPLPRYHDRADKPEHVGLRLHVHTSRFLHCHGKHEGAAASAGVSTKIKAGAAALLLVPSWYVSTGARLDRCSRTAGFGQKRVIGQPKWSPGSGHASPLDGMLLRTILLVWAS